MTYLFLYKNLPVSLHRGVEDGWVVLVPVSEKREADGRSEKREKKK